MTQPAKSELVAMAEQMATDVPYVPAGPPIGRREDWLYVIDSLIGGMESYEGVVKWLQMWPDLDTALEQARKVRDPMIAS